MKRTMIQKFPDLVPYFDAAYGQPAGLFYVGRQMPAEQSAHGCQQGCAWGTLCYSAGKLEEWKALQAWHPEVVFLEIVDDVFLCGLPEHVAAAFADWLARTEAPNLGKCKFYARTAAPGQHPVVQALVGVRQADGNIAGGVELVAEEQSGGDLMVIVRQPLATRSPAARVERPGPVTPPVGSEGAHAPCGEVAFASGRTPRRQHVLHVLHDGRHGPHAPHVAHAEHA